MSSEVEAVVRRYYALVGALDTPEADVADLLDPAVRVVEHPNAITPNGAVLDRSGVLAGLSAGRSLLRTQRFAVHEVLVVGDRAAARVTWSAETAADRGPLAAGSRLAAEVASFLTVRGGRIVDQETFDCYPPMPVAR